MSVQDVSKSVSKAQHRWLDRIMKAIDARPLNLDRFQTTDVLMKVQEYISMYIDAATDDPRDS